MKRLFTVLGILALAVVVGSYLQFAPQLVRLTKAHAAFTIPDPCSSQVRQSAPINISTATTTGIIAAAAGQGVYICNLWLNVSTNSATVQLEYGTGASCTGTNAMTGVIAGPATAAPLQAMINLGSSDFLQLSAPAGNTVCIVSGGTTPGLQGFVTYVQG